jgi:hypothetical protein
MTIPIRGIDFRGDPYMPLPPGAAYGAIGKQCFLYISFFVILYFKRKKKKLDGIFKY